MQCNKTLSLYKFHVDGFAAYLSECCETCVRLFFLFNSKHNLAVNVLPITDTLSV